LHESEHPVSRRTPRALVVTACAAALAAGLAACGDAEEKTAATAPARTSNGATAILAQTFGDRAATMRSGRVDAAFRLAGRGASGPFGAGGPLAVTLSGPFAAQGRAGLPRFDVDVTVDTGGRTFTGGAVSTGDDGFLKLDGRAYRVGRDLIEQFGGLAVPPKGTGRRSGLSLRSLGIDPRRWLDHARIRGTERVGGADTTHVTGAIDVPAFLADVNRLLGSAGALGVIAPGRPSRHLSPAARREIAAAVRSARIDVWTGVRDRILRRLAVAVRFAAAKGSRTRILGLSAGTLDLRLTVADLNERQEIRAPRDARPLSELPGLGALGGLLGGGGASRLPQITG
jgi:hypothetical protein